MVKDIFKIDKDKKVTIDKQKTVSPYNSVKHLKYAKDLPAYCKDCIYRSENAGGNGKCPKYDSDPDAVCVIRNDIKEFFDGIDTRKGEDLKGFLDFLIKEIGQNTIMALMQGRWDGNVPGRNEIAQTNLLLKVMQVQNELADKVIVSETHEEDPSGDISKIFKTLVSEKRGAFNKDFNGETTEGNNTGT